jgi:2-phospho-L-lactate/phosphoenolpyruvate guanylyltransferase
VRTTAILPVKDFAAAKQRLAGTGPPSGAGLPPADRESLAEAMFRDVLSALNRSRPVDDVLVVARGATPRRIAAQHGVRAVADGERGHNVAAQVGIEAAISTGAERVLLVPGDCPALDPADLDRLLSRPTVTPSVLIVPDRHETGTNALVLAPPDALAPSFGPGSCERHVRMAHAAGVTAEVVLVPSLATDVDTPEDLDALEASLASADPAAAPATRRALNGLTVPSK